MKRLFFVKLAVEIDSETASAGPNTDLPSDADVTQQILETLKDHFPSTQGTPAARRVASNIGSCTITLDE